MNLQFHPALKDVPLMSLEERAALADDMQRYGQKYEILVLNGNLIIDGRNRYLAYKQVGLEPKVRRIKNDDPKALYRSMTFFRRHWTKKELAVFGAKLTIAEEVSTDGLEKLSNESNSTKDVASAMGVGEDYAFIALLLKSISLERHVVFCVKLVPGSWQRTP